MGSVFFAHFSPYPSPSPLFSAPPWYLALIAVVSTAGVPVFFFISGYLAPREGRESFLGYLLSRRYLIPWLLWATILYFPLVGVTGGRSSWEGWARFLIGYSSVYYFLALLMLFEIGRYLFRNVDCRVLFSTGLVGGVVCSALVFRYAIALPQGYRHVSPAATYLNPLMFFASYSMGLVFRRSGAGAWAARNRAPILVAAAALAVAKYLETLVLAGRFDSWSVYFSPVSLIFGLGVSAAGFVLLIAPARPGAPRYWITLGGMVLPVYLVHLIFTGAFRCLFARRGWPLFPWHLFVLPLCAAGSFLLVWIGGRVTPRPWRRYIWGTEERRNVKPTPVPESPGECR